MACVAAMAHRGKMGSRSARGFNRALHVLSERLRPDHSPLYIGQTLVDVPATVIAQQSGGSVRVLAAFANEGMSMWRHCEFVVKPWLTRNARWALHDSGNLLGAYEELSEQTAEQDLLEIVEETLGGCWEKAVSG